MSVRPIVTPLRSRSGETAPAGDAPDGDDPNGDEALLRRIASADLAAFEAFYRRHYARLVRFVTRVARRSDVVDDVINDTMLVVWQQAARFRGDARPTTWLLGIAWRKTMQRLRQDARAQASVDLDEVELEDPHRIDEWVEDRHFGRTLRRCLDRLSPAHRAVVELTYFDGCTSREVGEILGCPEGTVRTRMLRARQLLRAMLVELDGSLGEDGG